MGRNSKANHQMPLVNKPAEYPCLLVEQNHQTLPYCNYPPTGNTGCQSCWTTQICSCGHVTGIPNRICLMMALPNHVETSCIILKNVWAVIW